MIVVSSCIFNLTVLGIFLFYCCTVFKLFMCQLGFPKPGSFCKTGFSVLGKAKTDFRFRFRFWKSHNCVHCKSAGAGVEVKDGADRTVCSAGNVQVATGDRGVRC